MSLKAMKDMWKILVNKKIVINVSIIGSINCMKALHYTNYISMIVMLKFHVS